MFVSKTLRKMLVPSAVAVVANIDTEKNDDGKEIFKCRPSELPIYSPDMPVPKCIPEQKTKIALLLETELTKVRLFFDKAYSESQAYIAVGSQYVHQGIDNAEGAIAYLRKENSTAPKAGAIVIGGLTGLIFGLRRGYFKRTLYATTGALTMSAICYPKQASEISQRVCDEGLKYIQIGYNFAYGVKKEDPPLELPSLPQLPSSVKDIWDYIYDVSTSLFSDQKPTRETKVEYGDEVYSEIKCQCMELCEPVDEICPEN